jgi:hypothetical protein
MQFGFWTGFSRLGHSSPVGSLPLFHEGANMYSKRFHRPIVITRHAEQRMKERQIGKSELLEVIDTGDTRYSDDTHLWAFKWLPARSDNLVCAVLVLENAVVVKTVMHHFEIEE